MPSIEIVTHCWSGDKVPIYHRLLQWQLNSLLNYDTGGLFNTQITVYCSVQDKQTIDTLNYFQPLFNKRQYTKLVAVGVAKEYLFRRAIGRNNAALHSTADIMWFTDCDHLFLGTSLHAAWIRCLEASTNMVHPKQVYINTTHADGDTLLNVAKNGRQDIKTACVLNEYSKQLFTLRKEKNAWGGLQIVKGDYARKHGYLNGTDWVNPVNADEGFRSCKCDVPYRKSCGGSTGVDIPNVYRIRHTRAGRDGGTVDHGEKLRAKATT